jgi:AbrB family looped-hinge helix DNA binding protein
VSLASTVSSKGQVTIPIEIRQRLGLTNGSRVEFIVEGGHTILRPERGKDDPFTKYMGIFAAKRPYTLEEIIREQRTMRGHEADERPAVRRGKRRT